MDRCLYLDGNKIATCYCTCHLDLGSWCDEHVQNHYDAIKERQKQDSVGIK